MRVIPLTFRRGAALLVVLLTAACSWSAPRGGR